MEAALTGRNSPLGTGAAGMVGLAPGGSLVVPRWSPGQLARAGAGGQPTPDQPLSQCGQAPLSSRPRGLCPWGQRRLAAGPTASPSTGYPAASQSASPPT